MRKLSPPGRCMKAPGRASGYYRVQKSQRNRDGQVVLMRWRREAPLVPIQLRTSFSSRHQFSYFRKRARAYARGRNADFRCTTVAHRAGRGGHRGAQERHPGGAASRATVSPEAQNGSRFSTILFGSTTGSSTSIITFGHTSLPQPGDERQLKHLSARVMAQQLDRDRPLWETWVVEGLEGDRFAMITKDSPLHDRRGLRASIFRTSCCRRIPIIKFLTKFPPTFRAPSLHPRF